MEIYTQIFGSILPFQGVPFKLVGMFDGGAGSCNAQDAALLRVKFQTLRLFPIRQSGEIFQKSYTVRMVIDSPIDDTVACKMSCIRDDLVREVVDEKQEQQWTQDGALGTPLITDTLSDSDPSTTTFCELPVRNDVIQPWRLPLMP